MYEVVTLILRFKCGREWEDNVSDLAQARWARIMKNQKFCPEPPSKILILRIRVSRSQLQTTTTRTTIIILFVGGMFLERRCLCFLCPTMAKEMHMRSSPIIFFGDVLGWHGVSKCHRSTSCWLLSMSSHIGSMNLKMHLLRSAGGMNMGEDKEEWYDGLYSVQMKLEDVSSQVHIGFSTSNFCRASLRMIPWCSSPLVFGFYMADALEVALRSDGRGGSSIIDGPHRDQFGYKGVMLSLSMSCWHLFDICRLEGVKRRSHQTPYHPCMVYFLHVPWKINHSCRLDGMGTISNQHPTGGRKSNLVDFRVPKPGKEQKAMPTLISGPCTSCETLSFILECISGDFSARV